MSGDWTEAVMTIARGTMFKYQLFAHWKDVIDSIQMN